MTLDADKLHREFSAYLVQRLGEIKEQMATATGEHLTYLRGMDAALYSCRLRFEGAAMGNLDRIITIVGPLERP